MRAVVLLTVVLALTVACLGSASAQSFYARGSYYAGAGTTWNADAGNQLFDDGQHDDGAAGDGIYGAIVVADQAAGPHEFKIADAAWTPGLNWPYNPAYPSDNARLVITGPGDTVRFRFDGNSAPGWQPDNAAVACDHGMPAGTVLELIGSAPELGSWNTGVEAFDVDGIWTAVVRIATPGDHQFKFRGAGSWDWSFGIHYNMLIGDNFAFTTTRADAAVRFKFNPADGRGYAVEFDDTPVVRRTWGRLKALYR